MQASARTCGRRAADGMIQNVGQSQVRSVKSIYFNHHSQGNSTNYYVILGPREKVRVPQVNKLKTSLLATPASFCYFLFFYFFLTHRRDLLSANQRQFPEHVERSFLDPEYSFVVVRRILRTIFAKQKFSQLRTNCIHRILPTMFANKCSPN